jgi:acyl-CoA synthetase (AMP-forming)/AMP-acid ligase II
VYVLDDHLQPAPIGVPGELYIGGVGVAHGYLHRPELTAERFLPCPFDKGRPNSWAKTDDEGWMTDDAQSVRDERLSSFVFRRSSRLYRTGDRVQWREDGTLTFLDRTDDQVKVRGFRVELGEVEARLRMNPAVADVAVVAVQGRSNGDGQAAAGLVAYVVTDMDSTSAEFGVELRRSLLDTWSRRPSWCWMPCPRRPTARWTVAH